MTGLRTGVMSMQLVWNDEKERIEWVDLSYCLGKTKTLNIRDGKPYFLGKSESKPELKEQPED